MKFLLCSLRYRAAALAGVLVLLIGPPLAESDPGRLVVVVSGLSSPLYLTHAPGIPNRLYVVEQGSEGIGRIKSVDTDTHAVTTVLTLTDLVTGGERGMLGLAFHPDVASNGYLYVYTSVPRQGMTGDHDSWIRRYSMTGPDSADPSSAVSILRFNQDFSNHSGGWIAFGPDGYLYVASGDGGSGGDPNNRAQNLDSLLGKMLRIDVDGDDFPADSIRNYSVPSDNPFVSAPGLDEIWAYGLRNPWRNSFDRANGDLYIGDVGQNQREEINFEVAGSTGGMNFGWRVMEGTRCNDNSQTGGNPPCTDLSLVPPVHEYPHDIGSPGGSVIGGYVYRGPSVSLQGLYFLADFIDDFVWSMRVDRTTGQQVPGSLFNWTETFNASIDPMTLLNIASFGEDEIGNVYIVSLDGTVYRIEGADLFSFAQAFGTTDSDPNYNISCDSEPDGDIDGVDLADFLQGYEL